MAIVRAATGTGRHRVEGTATLTGAGVVLCLAGGERPHIGAAAIGVPRPSLRDPEQRRATSSVLTITGHRDDELAKPLAEWAAARLGQVVVVTVGLHVERATAEDIAQLSDHARQVTESLVSQVQVQTRQAEEAERR